jgi:hypothetical protein
MMGQISRLLRDHGSGLSFWCQACREMHAIKVNAQHQVPAYTNDAGERSPARVVPVTVQSDGWTWNGSVDKPTFHPSVLVRGVQTVRDESGRWTGEWVRDAAGQALPRVCHSFVTDGRIQYLSDCTHELAGQTVEMVPWPGRAKT